MGYFSCLEKEHWKQDNILLCSSRKEVCVLLCSSYNLFVPNMRLYIYIESKTFSVPCLMLCKFKNLNQYDPNFQLLRALWNFEKSHISKAASPTNASRVHHIFVYVQCAYNIHLCCGSITRGIPISFLSTYFLFHLGSIVSISLIQKEQTHTILSI